MLNGRGVDLDLTYVENLDLRVFEIDIDSIFNNLLVNSIDAFSLLKEDRDRRILIKAKSSLKEIIIDCDTHKICDIICSLKQPQSIR